MLLHSFRKKIPQDTLSGAKTSLCVFMIILIFIPNDAGSAQVRFLVDFLKGEKMGPLCVSRDMSSLVSLD